MRRFAFQQVYYLGYAALQTKLDQAMDMVFCPVNGINIYPFGFCLFPDMKDHLVLYLFSKVGQAVFGAPDQVDPYFGIRMGHFYSPMLSLAHTLMYGLRIKINCCWTIVYSFGTTKTPKNPKPFMFPK
jgi:hypothetical protein